VSLRFYHNGGRPPKVLHRFRDQKRSADGAPLHVRDSASAAHHRCLALSCHRMRLGRSYCHCASERFCANPFGVICAPSFGRCTQSSRRKMRLLTAAYRDPSHETHDQRSQRFSSQRGSDNRLECGTGKSYTRAIVAI